MLRMSKDISFAVVTFLVNLKDTTAFYDIIDTNFG